MNTELLFQHVFNLFILSIIIQFSVNAITSIPMIMDFTENTIGKTVRDVIIIGFAIFICYKVPAFLLFKKVITLPNHVDPIISGLVLAGITFLIRNIIDKIRNRGED